MSETELNENNFETEILKATGLILVDFWAEWCGPCRVLSPVVSELAQDYAGKLKVGKVNVDENNALAARYGVMSIPTLKFFKDGKVVGEMIGAAPKSVIESELKKFF